MKKSTFSKVFVTAIASFAFICLPTSSLAQHGGGHAGAGGGGRTGGGFGGKHTGEAALEAARLAKAAGKPVSLKWTREEEFTWAYFRPAALIDVEASLDSAGKLTSWHFININSGPSAMSSTVPSSLLRTHPWSPSC